jgi:hypothetical protein
MATAPRAYAGKSNRRPHRVSLSPGVAALHEAFARFSRLGLIRDLSDQNSLRQLSLRAQRSNLAPCAPCRRDCFVASLLAMTGVNMGSCHRDLVLCDLRHMRRRSRKHKILMRPVSANAPPACFARRASGQHVGRPPKLTQQQKEARRRRAEGATLKELAKSYNVGRATISRSSL